MDNKNENISIGASIEALLFYSGEEFEETDLASLLGVSVDDVRNALDTLSEELQQRGLVLIQQNGKVQLGTHPAAASILEVYRERQFTQNLGKAALETLTIILYEAPVTKADIDYLRGVNSSTTLRQLLSRGLIEKVSREGEKNKICYAPTADALRHLGITSVEELPHYQEVQIEVEEVREQSHENAIDSK